MSAFMRLSYLRPAVLGEIASLPFRQKSFGPRPTSPRLHLNPTQDNRMQSGNTSMEDVSEPEIMSMISKNGIGIIGNSNPSYRDIEQERIVERGEGLEDLESLVVDSRHEQYI